MRLGDWRRMLFSLRLLTELPRALGVVADRKERRIRQVLSFHAGVEQGSRGDVLLCYSARAFDRIPTQWFLLGEWIRLGWPHEEFPVE